MSLADLVRSGVALAHTITRDGELQETVTLKRWTADDDAGKPTYAATLSLTAVVERKARRIRSASGGETVSTAAVTFLNPITALSPVVTGRREPVDPRDQITLQDGATGPILQVDGGVRDVDTGRPFLLQVFLG